MSGGFSHVFATESACECSPVHVNGKEEEELEEEMVLFRGVFCVLCLEICKLERDAGHLTQTHPPTHPPGLLKHKNGAQMCLLLKVEIRIPSDPSEKAPV